MPTTRQDADFAEMMSGELDEIKISKTALGNSIKWISDNLSPDEVFSLNQLAAWAESNGYVEKE